MVDSRVLRLGEVLAAEPRRGSRQVDRPGTPMPFVMTSLVSSGRGVLDEKPIEVTTADPKGRVTAPGDLLLVGRGVERVSSVGCATVRFDAPAAYAESLILIRVDESRVDPDFVRLYLTSRQGTSALGAAATGTVISNLRPASLKDVAIRVPDLKTQRAMVAALDRVQRARLQVEEVATLAGDYYDTLREGFAGGIVVPTGEGAT